MNAVARRLMNLVTALSLLLCVATAVLWVRSYWRGDALSWGTPGGRAGVESLRGRLIVGRVVVPSAALERIPRGWIVHSVSDEEAEARMMRPGWSFATFQASRVKVPGMTAEDVRVPYWLLAILTSALPAWWLLRRSRERRVRLLGLCPGCGYDLRASPGRCPECGTLASVSTNA